MKESPVKIDVLLEPLLAATTDDQAGELLSQLITIHAEPVIKAVIRFKLRFSTNRETQRAEADDIEQEAVLQLLAQLQRFRKLPYEHPINDLRGMAAVIAHRTCARWLRRQFPERHALKNRLHYLLTRQRGFALWQHEDGKLVAGFAVWQQQKRSLVHNVAGIEKLPKHEALAETVATIFNQLNAPIDFDELVSGVAAIQGISDQPVESLTDDEDAVQEPAAPEPDQAWRTEKRIFLQRLWEELQQLPRNQRAALLLNLKDTSGFSSITLFPATGIATLRQLAAALEINAEDFAAVWNELPLEDARIAEMLGLTRQQVINARKSGRERLARRLRGFI
ncbi:MAG TPA: sigma-70 family RNA polymerase sigma factor [Pyrinomonadaceae bacterium]|jgi:RNA polymerase sigma factor (sigma-70 family)|nr:sigma-70 family RNA polymerase sigma factor [Pyrinomonadaceae bacterium]